MALKLESPSRHNKLLEQKIQRPVSTTFKCEDDFHCPPSKRMRRNDSVESPRSSDEDGVLHSGPSPAPNHGVEIPDSEDEDEDGGVQLPDGQSALETSLPRIKSDVEAIAEYEAYKVGEKSLQDRLSNNSWRNGRRSIYVDAFNLALETVLEEEGHLFDARELFLFERWKDLSYEAQYLYVRLFLRKTSAWHRINKLGYHSDIADLDTAIADLQKERHLPTSIEPEQENPGELEAPEGTYLDQTFRFAECSSDHITTLDEASSLLLLGELKSFAKEAKINGKNKTELLKALRQTSGKQAGLAFRKSGTEESEFSTTSDTLTTFDDDHTSDGTVTPMNRDTYYTHKILSHTGKLIRLSLPPLRLFERVHLVFYRSTEWTEKSLTTLILAKISRQNFPSYIVSRSSTIFPSRSALLEFTAALRTQFRVDNILEFNSTPTRQGLEEVLSIFQAVHPRWQALIRDELSKPDHDSTQLERAYLRRFSPAWVYTRIVHKALHPLGRFKQHLHEHTVLTELLAQRLFHASRRGAWYQRKALLEEHYLWALTTAPAGVSLTEDTRKRHWKRVALRTCEEGLEDHDSHVIYHYDLQKRVGKLEKQLKVPVREQHDFGHASLAKPVERDVEGILLKPATPPTTTLRRNSSGGELRGRSTKTIWLDTLDTSLPVSVESMVLSHYRSLGWKGYHSEGGILRMLFGLLFFDILFSVYIPNVFQTPYQTCPLDLHTDAFYPSRISEIRRRVVELGNGEAERILRRVWDEEYERRTCVVGVRWEEYELDALVEIVRAWRGEALGTVMLVMAQEYAGRGGGVPDLFLWRITKEEAGEGDGDGEGGQVMFVEVKSENDRLSDTQRLWIHVLLGAGVQVELAHAVAKEVREID